MPLPAHSPAVLPSPTGCRWVLLAILLVTLFATGLSQAGTVFKCTGGDGSVSYQSLPCPTGVQRQAPTVQQLNDARQRRLRQQAAASAPAATAGEPVAVPAPLTAATPGVPAPPAYQCDGRTRCTQMHSCAEARFFLAHCPGVKMDGNHDGVPCEQQWCRR